MFELVKWNGADRDSGNSEGFWNAAKLNLKVESARVWNVALGISKFDKNDSKFWLSGVYLRRSSNHSRAKVKLACSFPVYEPKVRVQPGIFLGQNTRYYLRLMGYTIYLTRALAGMYVGNAFIRLLFYRRLRSCIDDFKFRVELVSFLGEYFRVFTVWKHILRGIASF